MDTLPIRLAALVALLVAAPSALGQPLPTTSYQGYLEQNGQPVSNPNATLTFRLFRNANGGSPLWTETKTGVAITDGVFNVALGSQTPLVNTLFDGLLFLSTAVGGGGAPQLSPRTVFRSVPYARTLSAPARIVGLAPNGDGVLRVENTAPDSYGLYGLSTSATGATYGVLGQSNSAAGGVGVNGVATATSGSTYGGFFRSDSPGGVGVYGRTIATSGSTYGAVGESASPSGVGVYGLATAASGYTIGVFGENFSTGGAGLLGHGRNTSGLGDGVRGVSYSEDGTGVYGINVASTGPAYGVVGETVAPGGRGVVGIAPSSATGVYGQGAFGIVGSTTNAFGVGVFGYSEGASTSYAGFFEGDVEVTGTLTRTGGGSRIDHPLDPQNRVLQHAAVESPDMLNVYNGNVTTDARGFATVGLPAYFEALNRDFRYGLTVIGQTFAQAIVTEEVRGNRFVIRTSEPGVRVSWQVTGVRQDAWAEANRIVVEEDKPAEQRGRYLHPTAFGQPDERGVDYGPERVGARTRSQEEQARLDAARERHAVRPPPPHDQ